jgi:hypothetical protein
MKIVTMGYFKVLTQQSPGKVKENHKEILRVVGFLLEVKLTVLKCK